MLDRLSPSATQTRAQRPRRLIRWSNGFGQSTPISRLWSSNVFFFVFLPLKQVTIVYGCPCRVNRVDRHDQVVRLYLTGVQRSGGAVDPDVQVNK